MATNDQKTKKGFIKDSSGSILLPITRAELILDKAGMPALHSNDFIAQLPDDSRQFDGLPGLITAAEKALLHTLDGSSGSGGGTISNIYNDLSTLFGISLSFNGSALNYYTDKVLNTIDIKNGEGITIGVSDSNVTVGLASLADKTDNTIISNTVITGITIDKFGRVTDVSGSNTLGGITLSGAKIAETITESSDDKAIVSKEYVDSKIDAVNATAVGALHFGSVLQNETQLQELWTTRAEHVNYYYKFAFAGTLEAGEVLDHSGPLSFKIGDTIIVHETSGSGVQFVYIPSGDEPVTSIGVKDNNGNGFDPTIGDVTISFAPPFAVSTQTGSPVVSLPILSIDSSVGTSGLLTKTDYDKFNTYAAKTVTYSPTVNENYSGYYEIGKLVFDSTSTASIYGKDTTYTLSVIDGYESGEGILTRDPKLIFESSSEEDATTVQIQGTNGVIVDHDGNTIKVKANNTVATDGSDTYLTVSDGYIFKVTIGGIDEEANTVTDGLADFRTIMGYISGLHSTTAQYLIIENSLSSSNLTYPYRYGSDLLINAVNIDPETE